MFRTPDLSFNAALINSSSLFGSTTYFAFDASVVSTYNEKKNVVPDVLFSSWQVVVEKLKLFGNKVEERKIFYNVINAVSKKDGCITAVSDERKLGKAAGYWFYSKHLWMSK